MKRFSYIFFNFVRRPSLGRCRKLSCGSAQNEADDEQRLRFEGPKKGGKWKVL